MIQFNEHIFQMGWFKHQPFGQDWELAEQQRDDALMALQLLGQMEDDPHMSNRLYLRKKETP